MSKHAGSLLIIGKLKIYDLNKKSCKHVSGDSVRCVDKQGKMFDLPELLKYFSYP